MSSDIKPTNAHSSGVSLDRNVLKSLARRSDWPGLIWLGQWGLMLLATGSFVYLSLGTWWLLPAMIVYGTALTVPCYALSHETAHGTPFKARWLNEAMFFISSFLFFEEPYHRRYAHTSHHTYTYHTGKDAQMPFDLPMTFREWLVEVTCVYYYWFEARIFVTSALGRFTPNVLRFTPQSELWKLKWSARFYLTAYGVLVAIIAMGHLWPLWLFILPRILGAPVMQLFTILQHAELSENAPSILASTRSFRTSWLASFLYMNMNNHVEHHLYPQVPFYALPDLRDALEKQVPAQDPGLWRTNWEVLSVVVRRSLGMNTKAATIRQAPHMVTTGGFTKVAKATMR